MILLNGVFSMSEIALISSRKFSLEEKAKKGDKNAEKALQLAGNPSIFLSTVQIGITFIGILTGIFSRARLTGDLSAILRKVPFLSPYADTLSVFLIVMVITYLSIIFGELLPKSIALSFPESIASAMARPMHFLSVLMRPFIWLLGNTNKLFLKIFGIPERQSSIVTEDEIQSIIAASTREGEIQEIEQKLVKRVFSLGDRKAGELMTHRSELVWLDIKDNLSQIREKIQANSHSVYPVHERTTDNLVGLVSVNEIFQKSIDPDKFNLAELISKPVYVHENMAAYRVLEHFKEHRTNLVVVVDEYGGVQGVLSIKDLVNSLIGNEMDLNQEDDDIVKRAENSWLADGHCPYYKLVDYFQLTELEEAEGFTTLAGLILSRLNNFPRTGDRMQWQGFEFEIMDMDAMRIDKVMITKL